MTYTVTYHSPTYKDGNVLDRHRAMTESDVRDALKYLWSFIVYRVTVTDNDTGVIVYDHNTECLDFKPFGNRETPQPTEPKRSVLEI